MSIYGFSGLNKNLNSRLSNSNNLLNTSNLDNLILAVRVKSIILDETHPRFKELGEWNALGTIEYEEVMSPTLSLKALSIAYPLNSNIKNLPLLNEIVYVITFPDTDIGKKNTSSRKYYISNIGLWNHPHHNGYPIISTNLSPSQQKDYIQTQAGSVRRVTDQSTEINLGKTFKERSNIHPLLPFEGDIIYEGRWGNSIRLGSTVNKTPNNWSSTGDNGDPITVIRNGQGTQTDQGWIPIIENINNDNSSIYLASTQNIPLEASSTSYISYNKNETPISPSKYSGAQIILDSGRLVFNAYGDHILLSSAKSINLNSLESVNIDTKKFITQADKIFLGKEDLAKEPLLLGDTTAQLLRDLTSSVKELATALQFLQSSPVTPGSPAIFPTLLVPTTKVLGILDSLNTQLGTSPDSCTITSKRNYTV
jgi:hypothetical protein